MGSARALERLCQSHDVFRWLCGGVSVNYHTLADFRVGCADLLDRLLSEHLAALAKAGLVDLDTLAQDGVRIRASAGASSFRREATLDRQLAVAQAMVEELKREVETHPDASQQRIRAAKQRAARERSERVQAAQTALAELKRKREALENKGGNGKKPKPNFAVGPSPARRPGAGTVYKPKASSFGLVAQIDCTIASFLRNPKIAGPSADFTLDRRS